ncbi:CLUMA_CG020275, isoform A [Clunio marinus]|uniref:CLUMA_CG020275, isoform A n=1 Tax=Clunio marinus TaxID=568069 RepID=A0A1J1J4H0_9DIPT|nr:CLUMA_CG020275, isoform A [Clunio marinus]
MLDITSKKGNLLRQTLTVVVMQTKALMDVWYQLSRFWKKAFCHVDDSHIFAGEALHSKG